MYVAAMAFFNRISDPRFGSTYMTLLNTVNTMGWYGSTSLALKMIDVLTVQKCSIDHRNSCSTAVLSSVRRYINAKFSRIDDRIKNIIGFRKTCTKRAWNDVINIKFKSIVSDLREERWRLWYSCGRLLRRVCRMFYRRIRVV